MGAEAVALYQLPGVGHHLLGRLLAARAGALVRVPIEEIARERHPVAQPTTEQGRHRHAQRLAGDVQAGEFECRQELEAIVVQARGGVSDLPAQRFQLERVMAEDVGPQALEGEFRALAAAAHLTQADQARVGEDLDNGAHEPTPVGTVGVPQGRFQRDRDRGDCEVTDPPGLTHRLLQRITVS